MKIKSLYCACNERTDNPLNHYAQSDCGAAPPGRPERLQLEQINAILADAQGDKYHAGGRLTATRILGCPRETLILDNKEIVYDVRQGLTTWHGTVKHRALKEHAIPGSYPEIRIAPFPFGEFEIEGVTDKVSADFKVIRDWKFHSQTSQGFKYERFRKGTTDPEGAAQLNIYRIGIAKSILKVAPEEYRPRLVLVHGAEVKYGEVGSFEAEQPLMSEAEVLALRPFDDEREPGTQPHTVKAIMQMLADATTAIRAGVDVDQVIREVPMVGRNVWVWKWNKQSKRRERLAIGDKCTKYCNAKRACFELAGMVV